MLRKILIPLAVLGAMLTAVASVGAATSKDSFDLKGEVYSTFKIEMKNSANRKLTTVRAGTHRIKIEDRARIHNFHLRGPGVDRRTSVAGTTETIWTVTLKPGRYTFFCDPHPSMRGTFRVT
jgi:plastocyanin